LDLGKLIILDTGKEASVTFGKGTIQARDNCVDFNGTSSGSAATTFPTFTLTKDASLGVSFSAASSDLAHLLIDTPAPVTDTSTTSTFQLSGTWTFAGAGVKTATITVTASYI
jgi:hypothetical protein